MRLVRAYATASMVRAATWSFSKERTSSSISIASFRQPRSSSRCARSSAVRGSRTRGVGISATDAPREDIASDRCRSALPGADADDLLDRGDEDLAVADAAGAGARDD